MQRFISNLKACRTNKQSDLLRVACTTALLAGKLIKERYNQPHDIQKKGVINLVTETDLAAEALILEELDRETPDIPVMAEESEESLGACAHPRYWVVDPLDGTTNFAHGVPHFAVSIALIEEGQPLVGAIYHPMLDELYYGAAGSGAWLNGQRIQVTTTDKPINALIATGFPYDIEQTIDRVMEQMRSVLPAVRDIRRAGAAALDLAFVACGRLDGFYEMNLQPWDTAAGWLLVVEAGGQLSDFAGNDYSPFMDQILASNGKLHAALQGLIR